MISSWSDAIGLSFAWSFGWGLVLTCYVLDWKIEWMQPKLWFLFLKKKLNKTEDFFLNASAIPPKVLGAFKKVLSILETGDFQNSSASIGQSYRKKLEHELTDVSFDTWLKPLKVHSFEKNGQRKMKRNKIFVIGATLDVNGAKSYFRARY